jgi:cell division protein FtsZ
LLDNVSISGASAVLLNITGGDDLTLGEATQISEIVHDAVGEEAEIIFGAGNDPAMQGEIRVTVIATGFDRTREEPKRADIITFPAKRREERHVSPVVHSPIAPTATTPAPVSPAAPVRPAKPAPVADVPDMEIPTFIRRQMD